MAQDPNVLLGIPIAILQRMDIVWTFVLMLIRFGSMFLILPGVGSVARGSAMKIPAIFVLALAATISTPHAILPENWGLLVAQAASETLLGFALGLIPFLAISAVQTGAQLASTTMGLGMGNLIDPTSGQQTSDMSTIMGDLMVVLFLMLGGHHAVIYAAAGLGGQIIPGTYIVSAQSIDLLVDQTSRVFEVGLLVSAPVIVALLLTNFVMGLMSKAVPSINVFIVGFPLSIGIGLILFMVALPDVTVFMEHQFSGIENQLLVIIRDTTMVKP